MADKPEILSGPQGYYYTPTTGRDMKYQEYLEKVAALMDSIESIEENSHKQIAATAISAERINSSRVNARIASPKTLHINFQSVNRVLLGGFLGVSRQFQGGFSGISGQIEHGSRQLGVMRAEMNMGFARFMDTIQESLEEICGRLDALNDIRRNPSLAKTRERYRRAVSSYTEGRYGEALEDLREAVEIHRADYISWFLLGKTYLFGRGGFNSLGEIVDVIDLDGAIEAYKSAAKYIQPDAALLEDARRMAAEIWFYLGLAQQTKAGDLAYAGETAASQSFIRQAQESFVRSWTYSQEMLEARYNLARCTLFLGDASGALQHLERLILQDPWYCLKIATDPDFDPLEIEFHALLDRMKRAIYPQVKVDFDQIHILKGILAHWNLSLTAELTRLMETHLPDTFTETLPYLDIREGKEVFPHLKELLEKEAPADEEYRQRGLRRQETLRRQEAQRRQGEESQGLLQAGLVSIARGMFTMGSCPSEPERWDNEGPQHQVTVSSFYLGKYPVTQREYEEIMGVNPSNFKEDTLPVECVTWYDAVEYCNRRSEREGLPLAYRINGQEVTWNRIAKGYRLPTEAEWEYACRAGTTAPFNTGDNITASQANYDGTYPYNGNGGGTFRGKTSPAGSFAPNSWGLYDMHGNVWEWCWDWYGRYSPGTQIDPVGPSVGTSRILRGGSWTNNRRELRSSYRNYYTPSSRYSILGFRLARLK